MDEDGDYTTPLVDDAECAYAYTEEGITFCAIEKAFRRENDFSQTHLHLYPIRLMNFERHGRTQLPPLVGLRTGTPMRKTGSIPVYKALRELIIRRFGEEPYKALETAEQLLKNQ